MISNRINTFLANFHYLNSKSKRAGCGFFCNKQLTHALEKAAKNLHENLTALAQSKLSEKDKTDAFFKAVEGSFIYAEQLRTQYGKVVQNKKDPAINMIGANGSISKQVWKKPYKPGNFETQLVSALNAVNNEVVSDILKSTDTAENAKSFQDRCNALMQKISSYQAPERALAEVVHKHHR